MMNSSERDWNDSSTCPLFSCNRFSRFAIPRFFFNVRDGADVSHDREGQEFTNMEAARREAVCSNREMMSERLLHGGSLNHRQIEVTDETGHVLDVVSSRDVLFSHGKLRSYDDDVTKSAPVSRPVK